MGTEMQKAPSAGLSVADAKKEFMSTYAPPQRAFPSRFEVKLDNNMTITVNGKTQVNDAFGKLFLVGHEEDKEQPEGFVNYREEIDFKKTGFFILRTNQLILGEYNPETKKFNHMSEEVPVGDPIELKDSEGNVVFEGWYRADREEKAKYKLSFKLVLYVMPVTKGEVERQVYRWVVPGSSFTTLFPAQKVINKASKEGRIVALKVRGTAARKQGKTDYNEILFDAGEDLPESVLPIWAEFNKGFAEYKAKMAPAKEAEVKPIEDVPYEQPDDLDEIFDTTKPDAK